MSARSFMLIAGETSGDMFAAELVQELKQSPELKELSFPAKFFGAGGPKMAEAGVELAFDLTKHSVIGLWEAVKKIVTFRKLCHQLVDLACQRQPDVIICVDFSEFNRAFAHELRKRIRAAHGQFNNWQPKLVKYISPQVWASRPGRANDLARDYDLLLSIFPFEKAWYAKRVPNLRVEFIGDPMIDRYRQIEGVSRDPSPSVASRGTHPQPLPGGEQGSATATKTPTLLLLPGSRVSELKRHLPVMMEAAKQIAAVKTVDLRMVLPSESLATMAQPWQAALPQLKIQIGGLAEALAQTDVAIASTGTVTRECAYFKVPTVALYKTSWSTYLIGKQIVTVRYLAMPNLLADEVVFPEFVQDDATAENIARETLDLLNNPARREAIKMKLDEIIASLGGPGANHRAARAILSL